VLVALLAFTVYAAFANAAGQPGATVGSDPGHIAAGVTDTYYQQMDAAKKSLASLQNQSEELQIKQSSAEEILRALDDQLAKMATSGQERAEQLRKRQEAYASRDAAAKELRESASRQAAVAQMIFAVSTLSCVGIGASVAHVTGAGVGNSGINKGSATPAVPSTTSGTPPAVAPSPAPGPGVPSGSSPGTTP